MNIHRALFFCFSSAALCDGEAETLVRPEGSSIHVACHFSLSGRKKFLCKDECTDEGILIETEGVRAQRGRYSLSYRAGTFPESSTVLYVTIGQLTRADSGRYRCALERRFLPDSYREFDIRVTDAPNTEPMKVPQQQQTEETAAALHSFTVSRPGYVLPLVVGASVVVGVLFAVVVLLLYKLKAGATTRGQAGDSNMEVAVFPSSGSEMMKCSSVLKREDSSPPAVYETSSDKDKIYCNL